MPSYSEQLLLHSAKRSLTTEEILKGISVAAGGSGYTAAPSVTIDAPSSGTQATATASIVGPVTGVAILNGGSGYTSYASVVFDPSGAQATPKLDVNGTVIAVVLDVHHLGQYTTPPTVTINPNGHGGSGASLQATMSVQKIQLTNEGEGYEDDPNVTIAAPTGPAIVCSPAFAYAKKRPDPSSSVDVFIGAFPKSSSYLTLDVTNGVEDRNPTDVFEIITEDNSPILTVNSGAIIEKDLMVGGFVNSWQGAINLNYGLKGKPTLSTPPCIQLFGSSVPYPSGSTLPHNPEAAQLFNHNGTKKIWDGDKWISGNFSGSYDTLFLFKSDGINRANIDVGNLYLTTKDASPKITLTGLGTGTDSLYIYQHDGTTLGQVYLGYLIANNVNADNYSGKTGTATFTGNLVGSATKIRALTSDPSSPIDGEIWLRTNL